MGEETTVRPLRDRDDKQTKKQTDRQTDLQTDIAIA